MNISTERIFLGCVLKASDMVMYGANSIVKKYARFPLWLPLPCHMEHGWTAISSALASDLSVKKGLMLVYSQRRQDAWRKESAVPSAIIGSPFVLYRRMNKIMLESTATGTIVFPSHSTNELDAVFDIDDFCGQLNAIPEKFKPVTVCLHFIDVNKGLDKHYIKNGLNVVSAGPKHNLDFVNNFYEIVSKHKYSCSNEVGSYSFYCVEMGLPFFLIGESPEIINIGGDKNAPKSSRITDWDIGKKATDIFQTGPITKISANQKEFVYNEMGVGDSIEPLSLNKMLWHSFWQEKYLFVLPLYYLINLYRKIRKVT